MLLVAGQKTIRLPTAGNHMTTTSYYCHVNIGSFCTFCQRDLFAQQLAFLIQF
jgi:hypothetical protein